MKTLKILGLLASVMMNFSSCELLFFHKCDDGPGIQVDYKLGLCFQDASGNNLVEGIGLEHWIPSNVPVENATGGGVIPGLYTLDILVSEPSSDIELKFLPDRRNLTRYYLRDNWYLTNDLFLSPDYWKEKQKIIFRLKCPYVFGDEKVREVATYWNVTKTTKPWVKFNTECYRIEFEGKEYEVTNRGYYTATIVLSDDDSEITKP